MGGPTGGHYVLTLDPGTYTLSFNYRKDGSVNRGQDCGKISNLTLSNTTGSTPEVSDDDETREIKNNLVIDGTNEGNTGEGELYNPVFFERIPQHCQGAGNKHHDCSLQGVELVLYHSLR